ncbi:tetratricopeptide repeat protein [Paractinoplanes abujensis]|uniref:Tetratricopeptide (TPR) repeat protein n=1 Tax=Paractinoplanes abujensis TaxID=882441 RepID=A0A7W7CSM7_9ACTN|nr:tetratricopeptide repeat protein [Actinoplanes abujensis]MBB4693929.1 tetratricopeptide (TPR) repeat protein [Actinoplanes abujensis]
MAQTVRVAGYEFLGRVVTGDGTPVGTCFQVNPGVLVTAAHVVSEAGDAVRVGPVAGGPVQDATVERLDEVHDLAVLRTAHPLERSRSEFVPSDTLRADVAVSIAGFPTVEDGEHTYELLTSGGQWQGPALRDRVLWARVQADTVMPGMSGAPVLRESDRAVAGVVSGRYMSAGGRLAGAVWVARVEDLLPLLEGLASPAVDDGVPPGGLLDVVLTVSDTEVRVAGAGEHVTAPHSGVQPGLVNALYDVRRERGRPRAVVRDLVGSGEAAGVVSLRRAGQLMAESFLPLPVAQALSRVLHRAQRLHVPARIGIEAPGRWSLPWEALAEPVTGRPLVMHDLVSVYRKVPAAGSRSGPVAGPLRIVVAIASPETGGGPLLDYERELGSVLDAVHRAYRSRAVVRIVPFATTAAIRAILDEDTTHVLHLSAHGSPGILHLEDEQGNARDITADELVREAIPEGRMPRVISLAACYTDAEGEDEGGSFAAQLAERGVGAVLATQTSVTDVYATRLFARVYAELAGARSPDVVAAVAQARRAVQRELAADVQPIAQLVAGMDEWSVVSVLTGSPSVTVVDGDAPAEPRAEVVSDLGGLLARPVGQFVGRRHAQRTLPTLLSGAETSGVLLHGIGGIGKTTLSAEIVRRMLDLSPDWRLATVYGEITVDDVLRAVAGAARRDLMRRQQLTGDRAVAVQAAERVDLPWRERFALLREVVLVDTAVLLVVDNFEDNLVRDQGWSTKDTALADLLATWLANPGRSRLLITCRYRFVVATDQLHTYQVPPLSLAETRKLLWSLPRLDRYTTELEAQEQIWRTVGGHPRALEYLDALLPDDQGKAVGRGRFDDITRRLRSAIKQRLGPAETSAWLAQERTLDAALADTVTLAAEDVLLTAHLAHLADIPDAVRLLAGISVYREPVDVNGLLFQVGTPNPDVVDRRQTAGQIMTFLAQHQLKREQIADAAGGNSPLSAPDRERLVRLLEDLNQLPRPPFSPPDDLAGLVEQLVATSLVTEVNDGRVVMHRWTATELQKNWNTGRAPHKALELVTDAHRAAAAYWQWRVDVWPQDQASVLHDLQEARHHLLAGGDTEPASDVTELICGQLHTWGAWDHETSLIHDILRRLEPGSPHRGVWHHQLGVLAQTRGDYEEAERHYEQSLAIAEEFGNQDGAASCYHHLGLSAQMQGDYDEAERRYHQALTLKEKSGDRANVFRTYGQLGVLAQDRGDYIEAERRLQQTLTIAEELGDQESVATTYHQLGMLAQRRGDYDEAERRYQQSLAIAEEFGDRANAAYTYGQLGNLAQLRGDDIEAARRYQQTLTVAEELGDRASAATGYHQLGTLAHYRGDHAEAERRYQQALTIKEEIGNRVGAATTLSQLGNLRADTGDLLEAVTFHCRALVIRFGLELPETGNNIDRLVELSAHLDENSFMETASTILDPPLLGVLRAVRTASNTDKKEPTAARLPQS